MAGLVAAARTREFGFEPVVLEKGDRPGGSMLLSSGVVWRHRSLADFRRECRDGDEKLQALVVERLDEGLRWLESLGARVLARETGNPSTLGWRFDTASLTNALVRAAGGVQLGTPFGGENDRRPLILATGGFQGDEPLVAEHIQPAAPLRLRANPWSCGDGLRAGLRAGGALSAGMDEFYGRNMPDAPFGEQDFVRLAQLYARYALVVNERGDEFLRTPVAWSETDVVQATARQAGALAWYVLDEPALAKRVRERAVADMVDAARAAGGTVVRPHELPFDAPSSAVVAVRVQAAITHTIGGLRIDERTRLRGVDGSPIEGIFAAGVDAGGVSTGGYASGLAAALVLGRIAAEQAVGLAT